MCVTLVPGLRPYIILHCRGGTPHPRIEQTFPSVSRGEATVPGDGSPPGLVHLHLLPLTPPNPMGAREATVMSSLFAKCQVSRAAWLGWTGEGPWHARLSGTVTKHLLPLAPHHWDPQGHGQWWQLPPLGTYCREHFRLMRSPPCRP